MKTGREVLEAHNDQPYGVIDGFITLEAMIDNAISEAVEEQENIIYKDLLDEMEGVHCEYHTEIVKDYFSNEGV